MAASANGQPFWRHLPGVSGPLGENNLGVRVEFNKFLSEEPWQLSYSPLINQKFTLESSYRNSPLLSYGLQACSTSRNIYPAKSQKHRKVQFAEGQKHFSGLVQDHGEHLSINTEYQHLSTRIRDASRRTTHI